LRNQPEGEIGMNINLEQLMPWLISAGIVLVSFIVGLIFEWVVIKSFIRLTRDTKWKWDDILAIAFKKMFMLWITIAGFYIATIYAPMSLEVEAVIFKVLGALATFVGVLVVARVVHGLILLGTSSFDSTLPSGSLIPNAARLVIIIVGIVFILSDLGIDIAPVIGALGIGGLAAALAFKDTLENLFSGFQLLATRKVRPGDYVQLGSGEIGFVTNISWRETTIRDFTNNLIIVPNSRVSQSIITNFNLPFNDIYVELTCGVSYDSDLELVEKIAVETAKDVYKEVMGKELEDGPSFFYLGFGDSAIDFKIKVLVPEFGDRMKIQHPLIKTLHKRFNEAGIVIPYPMRTIEFAEGHKPTS
jgi:small-conductance mechanosensitive channel